jgi:molybdopterin-guanine dinucleotide biosynthesis protein B
VRELKSAKKGWDYLAYQQPVVFQIVGYKNTGKTTLLCALIKRFKADGCKVGTIKHDGHEFEMDRPGTDTWQHSQAGADQTVITSATKTAWLINEPAALPQLVENMKGMDVVLAEGFKQAGFPKLILLKEKAHLPLLQELSHPIAAVYWPENLSIHDANASIPFIALNDVQSIFRLLSEHIAASRARR